MRHRTSVRLPDRADITGYGALSCDSGDDCPPDAECVDGECLDEFGNALEGETTIAQDVPCSFDDQSTTFVREGSGERVQRPATARFEADVDLIEGRTATFNVDEHSQEWEIVGIEPIRDKRRGRVIAVRTELERAD